MIRIATLLVFLTACATPQVRSTRGPVESVKLGALLATSQISANAVAERLDAPHFTSITSCLGDCGGTGGWTEIGRNTVTTLGKADVLNKYLKGSSYTAGWYLMLKHTGTIAVGDTLATHAGWTEATPYSGNRPTMSFGSDTTTNSLAAVEVSITMNATDADVKGACVASANTGTSGLLYSCTDFSVARSVISGDILKTTVTFTD